MKAFFKKHLWDLSLIVLVILIASSVLIVYAVKKNQSSSLSATIYHHEEVVQTLDLSKETTERTFEIQGDYSSLTIGVKKNAIAILKSGCPRQFCVHEGYLSEAGKPIVCAYNGIIIELASSSGMDVTI